MIKNNLVLSNNAYERDNTALTNSIILNHSQELLIPPNNDTGGLYAHPVAERFGRDATKQHYLFYDTEKK